MENRLHDLITKVIELVSCNNSNLSAMECDWVHTCSNLMHLIM